MSVLMASPHCLLQRRRLIRRLGLMLRRALSRSSALLLMAALLLLTLSLPLPLCAQIIADTTANPLQQPVIHTTGNGLPQVDITAPTAGGVSVNRFRQFDVDAPGAIVNNGRTDSPTALAGWVAANPALLATPARVIVGEVRGSLPSQLNGFVEIAGAKADFILTHPAGITCNGCGFLNAQRIELATGTPQWHVSLAGVPGQRGTVPSHVPGGPAGYVIGPGSFTVNGAGLDARTTSAASILTQAAQFNAWLWARHLQLTLAAASAPGSAADGTPAALSTASSTASSSALPAVPPSPFFALDVAALGGVVAHSIYLIGTADGIGVRNAGTLAANERLVVTVDGKLINEGTLDAQQVTVAAKGIDNLARGRLLGEQVALSADRVANAGHPDATPVIAAARHVAIGTRVLENTDGATIFSGDTMAIAGALDEQGRAIGTAQIVQNRAATIEALGDLQIATRQLYNRNGGVIIDERPLDEPTRLRLLQPAGSTERHDLSRFRFEGWSRAGQYRWITDTARLDDGVLGQTPMEPVADETCAGDDVAEVCTPVRGTAYPASDPVWAYFGLTPPGPAPAMPGAAPTPPTLSPPAPLPEGTPADDAARAAQAQQQAAYDTAWAEHRAHLAEHERATQAWTVWDSMTDARRHALADAIERYNARFHQQLIRSWTQYDLTRSSFQSVVTASAPAKILAGGDLSLVGEDLVNDRSQIQAGGRLSGTLSNLTQIDALGTHRVTETGTSQFTKSRWRGGFKRYHQRDWGPVLPYAPADTVTTIVLPVAATQEGAAPGTPAIDVATERLTSEGQALWQANPTPGSGPLFVTDARFTRYREWLSSDLMLSRLSVDPATITQRLGDGFIEQRLVREQIAQLTGRRWLPGYSNEEAQYATLLANGVHHAQAWQLRPGIALSAEQVSQLTSDLVWLVERDVTLSDGSTQRVLVPQVYLRPREGDLQSDGTLIAGATVDLLVRESLENAGTIAAQGKLTVDAGRIQHSGTLAGTTVQARAETDLAVHGGTVTARESAALVAGRDLTLESTTTTTERSHRSHGGSSTAQGTHLDRIAHVQVGGQGPGSSHHTTNSSTITSRRTTNSQTENHVSGSDALHLVVGRDLVLNAADLTRAGSGPTVIAAGRDLRLGTVTTQTGVAAEGRDTRNFLREQQRTDIGTRIDTQGNVILVAGHDATLEAVTVRSDTGALTLSAGRDIAVTAGEQTREQAQGTFFKHRSLAGSTRVTTRTDTGRTDVLGSELGAATLTIDAGRDTRVTGSTVVADGDLHITAAHDLTLDVATATSRQSEARQTSRSGIMGSGGLGVTVGRQRMTNAAVTTTTTDVGSTLGSVGGDVTLGAGTTLAQTGSAVLAPQGDIAMTAAAITLDAGTHHQRTAQRSEVTQSGVTLAVSNPVVAAVQTAQQMAQAASRTSDPRMQALAAANTAMATADAARALKAAGPDATGVNQLGGVQLSASIGSSRSSSETVTATTEAIAATVAAAGDVTMTAIGKHDANSSNSHSSYGGPYSQDGLDVDKHKEINGDLSLRGSKIAAGDSVRLVATGELNAAAAANTHTEQSTHRSSSASLGVVMSTQQPGIGMTVAGSRARGHADGQSQTWTETTIDAGQRAHLLSGADTTLDGAIVTAPQVSAAVGGDLTITSRQDTETHASRQQNRGGSVTIGPAPSGNLNTAGSRIDSRYASVAEVAGLKAGDGGFDVAVGGNLSLTGGVIASTDHALEAGHNRLAVEGKATTHDIANLAQYQASGHGVNIGAGYSPQGAWVPGGTGVGISSDDDQITSLTRAGISGGAGDATVRSVDEHQPLAKIFDAQRVQDEINAQVQITQDFSWRANQRLSNYVDTQRNELHARIKHAENDEEKLRLQALLTNLRRTEQAFTILVGAVTGVAAAAAGKELLSSAAEQMRALMIEDSRKFKGITDGVTTLSNLSGESTGVRGDALKLGGTRVDLDVLCGERYDRCFTQPVGDALIVVKDDQGFATFNAEKAGVSLKQFLDTPEGKKMSGLTGGVQGAKGQLFGIPYEAGSWIDQLIEAFAGTHDLLGGQLTGLYDGEGNIRQGMSNTRREIHDRAADLAVLPASPFAMADLLPPAVWQGISILLKEAR